MKNYFKGDNTGSERFWGVNIIIATSNGIWKWEAPATLSIYLSKNYAFNAIGRGKKILRRTIRRVITGSLFMIVFGQYKKLKRLIIIKFWSNHGFYRIKTLYITFLNFKIF